MGKYKQIEQNEYNHKPRTNAPSKHRKSREQQCYKPASNARKIINN